MAKNRNSSDATKASNKPNLNSINLSTKKTGVTDDLIASIKAKETIAVEHAVVKDEVKEETSISKPVLVVSPIAESTKPAKQIKNTNSTKSTDGSVVMKNVAVSLLPDDDMYLKLKAAEAGKKINAFFIDMMKADMKLADAGKINFDDSVVKEYQGKVYGKSRRTIAVDEKFTEEIKAAAMKYRMTYTNYVSYVIHKARLSDKNW